MLPRPCWGIQSSDGVETNKKSPPFMEQDLYSDINKLIKNMDDPANPSIQEFNLTVS